MFPVILLSAALILSQSVFIEGKCVKEVAKQLPKTIKAVGLYKYLPISNPESLIDLELPLPNVGKSDVLIEVKAVSVNPIDTKIRAPQPLVETSPRILGYDGSGVVVSKGEDVKLFNIGDEVFFASDPDHNGTNAEYISLNEFLVAPKPKTLSFEEAAAMPLTAVTAYESLENMHISSKDKGKSLLIINSAGGVGSVASQLANNLGLKVIGTASRKETKEFSRKNGVHVILNHRQDFVPQLSDNGFSDGVDYILVNYDPLPYWNTMMNVIKPHGKICLIVPSDSPLDNNKLKDKSVTLACENMTSSVNAYTDEDVLRHHEGLVEISKMLSKGQLKHTLRKVLSPMNAETLKEAHKIVESQRMIGKLVVSNQ